MTAKSIAVLLLASLSAGFNVLFPPLHAAHPVSVNAQRIALLPATLGDAPMLRHWRNVQENSVIEEGANYGPADGTNPVQLDFFRNYPSVHNSIGCFLSQGETLVSEQLRQVDTRSGPALFDTALLRTAEGWRLVAATECAAQSCTEQTLPHWYGLLKAFRSGHWLTSTPSSPVVPVSVVLTHATGDERRVQDALLTQFAAMAKQLDLAPAQKLAAIQAGVR